MDNFPSMKEFTINDGKNTAFSEENVADAFRNDAFFGIKDTTNDVLKDSKTEDLKDATQGLTNDELDKSAEKILENIPKLFVFDGPPGAPSPAKVARQEIVDELKVAEQSDQLSLLVAKANLIMASKGETDYLRIMSTPNQAKASSEPAYSNHYEVQLVPTWKYGSLITDFVFDGKKTERPKI